MDLTKLEIVNMVFDVLLVVASIYAIQCAFKVGGVFGKSLNLITFGLIFLGFAHLTETILFNFFGIGQDLNEFIHRIIVLISFIFIILEFKKISEI